MSLMLGGELSSTSACSCAEDQRESSLSVDVPPRKGASLTLIVKFSTVTMIRSLLRRATSLSTRRVCSDSRPGVYQSDVTLSERLLNP